MSVSSIDRLRKSLEGISSRTAELVASTAVLTLSSRGVIFIGPQHYFDKLPPDRQKFQLDLKRDYERWIERVRLLLASAPKNLERQIDKADKACRAWIELSSTWSVKPNRDHNATQVTSDFGIAAELLDVFGTDDGRTLLVPDTNSLLADADPRSYRRAVDQQGFLFILTPTVLRELDELKVLHRNPDVREKAQKVITRIKGWRKQGDLLNGVTVDRSITVTAIAEEPDVSATLSWLDGSSSDDRIIASVLLIEARYPTSRVVLVTGDINLQNKADAAEVETAEL